MTGMAPDIGNRQKDSKDSAGAERQYQIPQADGRHERQVADAFANQIIHELRLDFILTSYLSDEVGEG